MSIEGKVSIQAKVGNFRYMEAVFTESWQIGYGGSNEISIVR
jgi:hypothetical protein